MTETTSLSDLALGALISYGPLALALTLMLGGAGLPLPGSVVLLAAGAFAQQGFIEWHWALLAGVGGVILGDSIAYAIGRTGGAWAERRFGQSSVWQSATQQFARRGGWAIFLSRWLITPLGVAISLIAGVSAYAFPRFLFFDLLGEIIWVTGYGAVGYALGTQWQTATSLLTDFSGLILGVTALVAGAVIGIRMLRRRNAPQPGPEALESAPALTEG